MKNSVLDNVSIDIFDDSIVTTDDLEVNFMISPEDVGKKVMKYSLDHYNNNERPERRSSRSKVPRDEP